MNVQSVADGKCWKNQEGRGSFNLRQTIGVSLEVELSDKDCEA